MFNSGHYFLIVSLDAYIEHEVSDVIERDNALFRLRTADRQLTLNVVPCLNYSTQFASYLERNLSEQFSLFVPLILIFRQAPALCNSTIAQKIRREIEFTEASSLPRNKSFQKII
jgi:hypothetical protein